MIYGERIRFRGVEREDLPTFVKWLNDPEVRQGILVHSPVSQADEENWFERMIKRPPDEHVLGIEVRLPRERANLPGERAGLPRERANLPGERAGEIDDGAGAESWRLIGTFAFDSIDWHNRSAEFGIMIGEKSYWNQGYGTEAVRLLTHHGFKTLNLNRIFLHVFENNTRAIRAYEKAGFIHEGRERQAEFTDGRYIDVLRMSMLKDEF
jgi:RimJ/RimL family protein N-acetyltransferase